MALVTEFSLTTRKGLTFLKSYPITRTKNMNLGPKVFSQDMFSKKLMLPYVFWGAHYTYLIFVIKIS